MTFELGKTYLTQHGKRMAVILQTDAGFAARGGSFPDSTTLLYRESGVPEGTGFEDWILLPGSEDIDPRDDARAIPHRRLDEAPALAFQREHETAEQERAVDPICVLQGQIDNLSRIIAQAGRDFEKLERVANGAHIRLDVLNRDTGVPGVDLAARVEAIHERVNDVWRAVDDVRKEFDTFRAVERLTRPKPTIKGGWFNVYRGDYGRPQYVGPYSREMADSESQGDARCRIACIQIPDITEGEGL